MLQGVDAPAHVSLPYLCCDTAKGKRNTTLILLVSGSYCIFAWLSDTISAWILGFDVLKNVLKFCNFPVLKKYTVPSHVFVCTYIITTRYAVVPAHWFNAETWTFSTQSWWQVSWTSGIWLIQSQQPHMSHLRGSELYCRSARACITDTAVLQICMIICVCVCDLVWVLTSEIWHKRERRLFP